MLVNEIPPADLEKSGATLGVVSYEKGPFDESGTHAHHDTHIPVPTSFQKWNAKIEGLAGLEARGIVRVLPEERQLPSKLAHAQMAIVWFVSNYRQHVTDLTTNPGKKLRAPTWSRTISPSACSDHCSSDWVLWIAL